MSLIKTFSSYTLINVFSTAIPYLLLPVLTNYLTDSDYGILSNIQALFFLFVPLVGINVAAAVGRQYFKEEVQLNQYTGTSLAISFIAFALIQLITFVFGHQLSSLTQIPYLYFLSISLYAFFHNIMEIILIIWRMQNRVRAFGIFRVTRTILEIIISLFVVVQLDKGWEGRYLTMVGIAFIFGLIAIYFLLKENHLNFQFNKVYANHFLKYGLFLIPHSLSGVLLTYSDKFIITDMLGVAENGVYSVAMQIGMVIALIQTSFNQAWTPWFFERLTHHRNEDKFKIVKITYLYSLALLLFVVVLWLSTPLIYLLLGSDFQSGQEIVVLVGLTFALNGIYSMVANYLFFVEKTYILSLITFSVTILNIILNINFIPKYGILGAAYASVLSMVVQVVVVWYFAQKTYAMPWLNFIKKTK